MKFKEKGKSSAGKKIVWMATGREEIELLVELVSKSIMYYPKPNKDESLKRLKSILKNMNRTMRIHLGTKKERIGEKRKTPCKYCERSLKGEKALQSHIIDSHSYLNPNT